MTTVRTLFILLFYLLLLISCSQRGDILLSASDELHYIKLFEIDNEFEIIHNGFNTTVGNYEFKNDTIYLNYTKNKTLTQTREGKIYTGTENEFLTKKLIIDSVAKRIYSADGKGFCALISSNRLKSK
jgi:hypothetical protein